MKKIILFSIFILLFGCDRYEFKIVLENKSDKTIYYQLLLDTNLIDHIPMSIMNMPPNTIYKPTLTSGKGDHFIEDYIFENSKDSSLHIYFFDTSEINEKIVIERRYKRIDLKVKDLDSLKWHVTYE